MTILRSYIDTIMCSIIPKPQSSSLSLNKTLSLNNKSSIIESRIPLKTPSSKKSLSSSSKNSFILTPLSNNLSLLSTQISAKEQFYRDMRSLFHCDSNESYGECVTDSDCNNNLEQCINHTCVPNLNHCANTGCSTDEQCNLETGRCEPSRKSCSTDDQCGEGYECRDNLCYKKTMFCRDDTDCIGVTVDGIPHTKCNTEANQCVPCNFGQPSMCALIDPSKPSCHVTKHICFPSCDPDVPANLSDPNDPNGCCTIDQVSSPEAKRLAPHRLENCCSKFPITLYKDENVWGGVEKCCLDESNSGPGKRNCNNWAGKSMDDACCINHTCNTETGQCVPK